MDAVNTARVVRDRLKPYMLSDEFELTPTPVAFDQMEESPQKTPVEGFSPEFSSTETEGNEKTAEQPNVSVVYRCLQFMIPLAAIIGGSMVGPMCALQPPAKLPGSKAKKAFLLSTWRFGPLSVLLLVALPFYALYVYKTSSVEPEHSEKATKDQETPSKIMEEEEEQPSTLKLILILIVADVAQLIGSAAFVGLSFYTVMSHVYLLTNLHGVLTLIASIICCGVRTHWLEKVGIFVIISGASLMIFDPSAVKYGQQVNVIANVLCLPVNICFALFFVGNSFLKKHFSISFLIMQSAVSNFIIYGLLAVFLEGAPLDTSDKGVFGFLRPENWVVSMIGNGLVSAFFGLYGYVWALKYFSPVFVMNCLLVEPVLA